MAGASKLDRCKFGIKALLIVLFIVPAAALALLTALVLVVLAPLIVPVCKALGRTWRKTDATDQTVGFSAGTPVCSDFVDERRSRSSSIGSVYVGHLLGEYCSRSSSFSGAESDASSSNEPKRSRTSSEEDVLLPNPWRDRDCSSANGSDEGSVFMGDVSRCGSFDEGGGISSKEFEHLKLVLGWHGLSREDLVASAEPGDGQCYSDASSSLVRGC